MRYIDFELSEKIDTWLSQPDHKEIMIWLDNRIALNDFKELFNDLRIDTQLSLKAFLNTF